MAHNWSFFFLLLTKAFIYHFVNNKKIAFKCFANKSITHTTVVAWYMLVSESMSELKSNTVLQILLLMMMMKELKQSILSSINNCHMHDAITIEHYFLFCCIILFVLHKYLYNSFDIVAMYYRTNSSHHATIFREIIKKVVHLHRSRQLHFLHFSSLSIIQYWMWCHNVNVWHTINPCDWRNTREDVTD